MTNSILLIFFAGVVWFVNGPLIKYAPALLDADNFIYPLASERFSFFPYTQTYGAMCYTALRVFWVKFLTVLGGDSLYSTAHMSFSFLITPFLLSVCSYYMLRSYCSKLTSALVGCFAAFGFHFWLNMAGIDIYMVLVMLGCIFLMIGAKLNNPFFELSEKKLFLMGVFSGFSFFTFQPTLLFISAFFAPWAWLETEFKKFWQSKRKQDVFLKSAMVVLILLFIFTPFYIKALPNLKLACLCFLVYLVRNYYKEIKKTHLMKLLILVFGFVIGFLPQIIYWWQLHGLTPLWHPQGSEFKISSLAISFSELILGRSDSVPYNGGLKYFPLILFGGGLIALVMQISKDKRLIAPLAIIVLNLIALFNITMTAITPTKYLFPVYPSLILAAGVLVDWLVKQRLKSFAVLFVILSCIYQAIQRKSWGTSEQAKDALASIQEFSQQAAQMNVPYVWSDTYWHTLQYSFFTHEKPIFGSETTGWRIRPTHWVEPSEATTVGVFLTGIKQPDSNNNIIFGDKKYHLELIKKKDRFSLYLAKRI